MAPISVIKVILDLSFWSGHLGSRRTGFLLVIQLEQLLAILRRMRAFQRTACLTT